MLKLVKTGSGASTAPLLVCDACKTPIRDADLALYIWRKTLKEGTLVDNGDFFQIHKPCRDLFIANHGGKDAYDWPDMELTALFEYLLHNSGVKLKDLHTYIEQHEQFQF